jgi:TetR/AcrR family transcriptional regulator, cholesterol catabolism regulator
MSAPRKLSRELLLDKTAHLFAERGYEDSTIATITAELGVTRPTLYTYTRSKQELVEAIYDRLFDFYRQALPEYVHLEDPPLQRIWGIIELQLEATTRLRDHLVLVLRRFDELVERYPHIRAWWHELDTILLTAIEEARARGECSPEVDTILLKHAIWAVINDLPFWYKPGRLSKQDIAGQLVLLFSAGSTGAARSEAPGGGTGQ